MVRPPWPDHVCVDRGARVGASAAKRRTWPKSLSLTIKYSDFPVSHAVGAWRCYRVARGVVSAGFRDIMDPANVGPIGARSCAMAVRPATGSRDVNRHQAGLQAGLGAGMDCCQ